MTSAYSCIYHLSVKLLSILEPCSIGRLMVHSTSKTPTIQCSYEKALHNLGVRAMKFQTMQNKIAAMHSSGL